MSQFRDQVVSGLRVKTGLKYFLLTPEIEVGHVPAPCPITWNAAVEHVIIQIEILAPPILLSDTFSVRYQKSLDFPLFGVSSLSLLQTAS